MKYAQCERRECSDPLRAGYMVILERDDSYKHYCGEYCAMKAQ